MSTEPVVLDDLPKTKRGTSNRNDQGSAEDRRRRRAWLMMAYASNVPGFCRCYRCGCLLFNPDDMEERADGTLRPNKAVSELIGPDAWLVSPLTVARIIPGCKGGTYRRNNIRPACVPCNPETGGKLAARKGQTK